MVLLNASRIQGFWRDDHSYEMVDTISGKTRLTIVPGAGYSDLVTPEELEDIILEYEEKFLEDLQVSEYGQARQPFSRQQQHDLGKVANEIKDSQKHRSESQHGRYW